MNLMTCTTCKQTVLLNNTGICLACQQGFTQVAQRDKYYPENIEEKKDENNEQENNPK